MNGDSPMGDYSLNLTDRDEALEWVRHTLCYHPDLRPIAQASPLGPMDGSLREPSIGIFWTDTLDIHFHPARMWGERSGSCYVEDCDYTLDTPRFDTMEQLCDWFVDSGAVRALETIRVRLEEATDEWEEPWLDHEDLFQRELIAYEELVRAQQSREPGPDLVVDPIMYTEDGPLYEDSRVVRALRDPEVDVEMVHRAVAIGSLPDVLATAILENPRIPEETKVLLALTPRPGS